MESTKLSKNRGGARKGAGRKGLDPSEKRVILSLYLKPVLRDKVKALAGEKGQTPSEYLSDIIASL